ncbi:MAG: lysostaphin resistance A-like protein [Bryobacteraceae bacterium]
MTSDPKSAALRIGLYAFLYLVVIMLLGPISVWISGYFFASIQLTFAASVLANLVSLRIWERRSIFDLGLRWNEASWRNFFLGVGGGGGVAALVLATPLALGLARIVPHPEGAPYAWSAAYLCGMLLLGSAGEELLLRGYAFQVLLRISGPYTTILPVGVLFAALHGGNPGATWLALANTAGFGILFGYAFLRSRDLWLPIGLHFGWNLTLPLFGVNVSGFTMRMTGYTLDWDAGALLSGGEYGPEASILTSGALAVLAIFLVKAPIRRQPSPLLDPPDES